jgi:hypothetical protein
MIGSIAVMQSNNMGFDWLGWQICDCIEVIKCSDASTNLSIFSKREKSSNGFVLFCFVLGSFFLMF